MYYNKASNIKESLHIPLNYNILNNYTYNRGDIKIISAARRVKHIVQITPHLFFILSSMIIITPRAEF